MKIGAVELCSPFVVAPMAGMTDSAFRRLVKRHGACGLVVTEMVSSEGLVRGIDRTLEYAEYTEEERPVSIQIFGGDPDKMAEAARIVEAMGADIVDVNMGCPVPKIAKHNAGCSLMREPAHAATVIGAMAKAVSIPGTVKMRAGWNDTSRNAPDLARRVQDAGAAAVTIHGRTAQQSYTGTADWDLVRRLRISTITADGVAPRERPDMAPEEIVQCRAQKAFLESHPELALDLWRAKPWEPAGPVELAVVGQALAQAGDESAAGYIGRLFVTRPLDAQILLAELRWRQGRFPESADLYEQALTRYRSDPWPLLPVVNRSFVIVADLAGRDPALARKMDAALSQPFAVLLLNEERLQTRYKVATYLDQSKLEEAIAALEPHVPWRKGLLSRRAKVYDATNNPLAARAHRELDAYLKNEDSGPSPAD